MKRGYFITLEGIEGAGKSTAVEFITSQLKNSQIDFILTREPGGTEVAERIRALILDHYQEAMHPDTEMLLYFASRAQHLNQVIIPALVDGKWVICDRFTDATYAYQGGGRGIAKEKIAILENWVQQDLRPDYTLLFDVEAQVGLTRIQKNRNLDRIEKEDESFFTKVRNCYLELARRYSKRFRIIDANHGLIEVAAQVENIVGELIKAWRTDE